MGTKKRKDSTSGNQAGEKQKTKRDKHSVRQIDAGNMKDGTIVEETTEDVGFCAGEKQKTKREKRSVGQIDAGNMPDGTIVKEETTEDVGVCAREKQKTKREKRSVRQIDAGNIPDGTIVTEETTEGVVVCAGEKQKTKKEKQSVRQIDAGNIPDRTIVTEETTEGVVVCAGEKRKTKKEKQSVRQIDAGNIPDRTMVKEETVEDVGVCAREKHKSKREKRSVRQNDAGNMTDGTIVKEEAAEDVGVCAGEKQKTKREKHSVRQTQIDAGNMRDGTIVKEEMTGDVGVCAGASDGVRKEQTAASEKASGEAWLESASELQKDKREKKMRCRERRRERKKAAVMQTDKSDLHTTNAALVPEKGEHDSKTENADSCDKVTDRSSSPSETKSPGKSQVIGYERRRGKKKLVDVTKHSSSLSNHTESKRKELVDANAGQSVAEEDCTLVKDANNSSADDKAGSKKKKKDRCKGRASSVCSSDARTEEVGTVAQQVSTQNCASAGHGSVSHVGEGDSRPSRALCNSHNENIISGEPASDLIPTEHPASRKSRKVRKETDKSANCYVCPSPIRGVVDDLASVNALVKLDNSVDSLKDENASFSFQTTEQGFRKRSSENHVKKACQSGSKIGTDNISSVLNENTSDSMSCTRKEMIDGQREKAISISYRTTNSSGLSKGEDQKTEEVALVPERTLVTCTKKKLLVLDLNGLLAYVAQDYQNFHKPCKKVSGKAVYKRPFCDDFLKFCFEEFDVGVWSSRKQYNVDEVVDYLMGNSKHKLLFCWDQSRCTVTGSQTLESRYKPLVLKELKKLWNKEESELPWEEGDYTPSNTLLVDDSPYKAICNPPYTAIFPQPYHVNDEEDNSLGPGGDLRVYLEALAIAENVQDYVREHPFGQPAITESDPSWGFYLKIRDKFSRKDS